MIDVDNPLQLSNLSKTRWTSRAESIKAFWLSYESIISNLEEILIQDFEQNIKTKALGKNKVTVIWLCCLSCIYKKYYV